MARKIVHQLIDDVDGTVLAPGSGETVLFSLDGVAYEIDLTSENADALRAAIAPYVTAGRRISGASSAAATAPRRRRSPAGASNTPAIREWARANGRAVSDRGRIPAEIIAAYEAAH